MLNRFLSKLYNLFFHHLYHKLAWGYDFVAKVVSGGEWFAWGSQCESFLNPGSSILEIGFGTGHLQEKLIQQKRQVVGLDESWSMAKITAGRSPFSMLVRGEVTRIPFRANVFDAIISNFPSEYIFDPETIHDVFRVLNPDGKLIILLGVSFHGKTLLDRFYRFLYMVTGQIDGEVKKDKLINLAPFLVFPERNLVEINYKTKKLQYLILKK